VVIFAAAYEAVAAMGMFQIESQENGQLYGLLDVAPEPDSLCDAAAELDWVPGVAD
jgi:hypothetical protein